MPFGSVKLDVKQYGTVFGQYYQPEACSDEQPDQRRSITKDDPLVILLHGWGADGSDLASLAPSLLGPVSVVSVDTTSAHHKGLGGAVFVPDAPDICSENPSGRQWFELSNPASGIERNASACLQAAGFIAAMLDSLSAQKGYVSDQIILGGVLTRRHGFADSRPSLSKTLTGIILFVRGMVDPGTNLSSISGSACVSGPWLSGPGRAVCLHDAG